MIKVEARCLFGTFPKYQSRRAYIRRVCIRSRNRCSMPATVTSKIWLRSFKASLKTHLFITTSAI